MQSIVVAVVVASSIFSPEPQHVLLNPETGAPKQEIGILSAPLEGELPAAVQAWALSQRQRYQLPAASTLKLAEAFSTRFGASFHFQQTVNGVDVYQSKLVVTLDGQRQVTQASSSLVTFTRVLEGENWTREQALTRAGTFIPWAALRPDGVPYGGAKAFYFQVGDELHRGFVANVHSFDFSKNWYVGLDAVTGERLFVQNRVHHAALDAKVYPVSPGGLDAGVGVTPLVTRSLTHADGSSMLADTCINFEMDGGTTEYPNDAGELCGTQLMAYNCCPSEGCEPDAGPRRYVGTVNYNNLPVAVDIAMCDRTRRASNIKNSSGDFSYTPIDPPANKMTVLASDLANSDEFAEVHSFYHVNSVYDWVRGLSARGPAIFHGVPDIAPFKMRDEKKSPPVKPAVWANVMFPNFNEILSNPSCVFTGPCKANTLMRVDNAAFFPRENFSQLPLPGLDTGADTLMIFQGNAADAAYDSTVIQHEFGHGVVYATANLSFSDTAIDNRSANNEGGALHEGFADYISAAFNNLADVGPYFGPRVAAGLSTAPGISTDGYLRSMNNTKSCPSVLWGEVHQDSEHVAGALWQARQTHFLGTDSGATYDAAFYAMLVSIAPNADFAAVAATMASRVAAAFPSITDASAKMTQIFESRGVIGCSKVLEVGVDTLPRAYFGIPTAMGLGTSILPGPIQFKLQAPQGAARIHVSAKASGGGGGGFGGGGTPVVTVMTKIGAPITFTKAGTTLTNDATKTANTSASGSNLTASVELGGSGSADAGVDRCNAEIYVALGARASAGATLQDVDITIDPDPSCTSQSDGGTGGGTGSMTTVITSVGPQNTASGDAAKVGCGCSSAELGAPLLAMAMMLASARRRRR